MTFDIHEIEESSESGRIKVIGVGGGGGNAVDHMIASNVQSVEFICANTDAQALNRSKAPNLIRLGENGLGAGSKPEKGREAAETATAEIREALAGANLLFITAGMGGGTGTGAAPVVANIARDMGILTVAVVTKPFEWEGKKRMENAEDGLAELQANVDSLIVILNEKLLEVYGDDLTQFEAYGCADDVLRNAVGGIAEVIASPGQINVDFEDVRTVMGEPGKAIMGTATATGVDRARIAAEQAVDCPLLDGTDLASAKAILLLVSGTKESLKMSESRVIAQKVRESIASDHEPHIIYGSSYDEILGDSIRVTIIATGLESQRDKSSVSLKVFNNESVQRTGTDNQPVIAMPILPSLTDPSSTAFPNAQERESTAVLEGAEESQEQRLSNNLQRPAVWRTNRGAKGGSGAEEGTVFKNSGDLNIPAFLRK